MLNNRLEYTQYVKQTVLKLSEKAENMVVYMTSIS